MILNSIELINCLDGMKHLPENSVDMVCTDPPYFLDGLGNDWDKNKIDKKGASSVVGNLPSTRVSSDVFKRPVPYLSKLSM